MADKFSNRPDFEIPSSLIDEHEWVSDEFIDGPFGKDCLLEFPQIDSECPNCFFDPISKRSTNIYKTGGPISFTDHTTCPHCGGAGRSAIAPETEAIRLRVYWSAGKWGSMSPLMGNPEADCRVIGYTEHLPKFERAAFMLIQSGLQTTRRWRCVREGEARPHGFRGNRYFQQVLKRVGGG
jgi:hypothetical protein